MTTDFSKALIAGASSLALLIGAGSAVSAEETRMHTESTAEMKAEATTEQNALVDDARYTVERFTTDDQMTWLRDNIGDAKAIMIVPEQVKGAFIVGASGGNGVVLSRTGEGDWSYPAFYTVGSLSVGFQAGGEVSEIVLVAMTDAGAEAFKSPQFKLGGDVSIAAGPVGIGAKAQTIDIVAFSRSQGLFGGISLEGAVVDVREEWNHAYYGKTVTPAEILAADGASNDQAGDLIAALKAFETQAPTAEPMKPQAVN